MPRPGFLLSAVDRHELPLIASVSGESFEITGIVPGRYRIDAHAAGRTWWVKSLEQSGGKLSPGLIEIGRAPELSDLVVTFSRQLSEIRGTLSGESGQPETAFWIAAVPADRERWHPTSAGPVRLRPDTNGEFVFADLPVGDYRLAVFEDIGTKDWLDRTFLEQLATAGVSVAVRSGAPSVQALRVSRSKI